MPSSDSLVVASLIRPFSSDPTLSTDPLEHLQHKFHCQCSNAVIHAIMRLRACASFRTLEHRPMGLLVLSEEIYVLIRIQARLLVGINRYCDGEYTQSDTT